MHIYTLSYALRRWTHYIRTVLGATHLSGPTLIAIQEKLETRGESTDLSIRDRMAMNVIAEVLVDYVVTNKDTETALVSEPCFNGSIRDLVAACHESPSITSDGVVSHAPVIYWDMRIRDIVKRSVFTRNGAELFDAGHRRRIRNDLRVFIASSKKAAINNSVDFYASIPASAIQLTPEGNLQIKLVISTILGAKIPVDITMEPSDV